MTSSPYSRTPLTLRWKISPSPNVCPSWTQSLQSLMSTWSTIQCEQCPIMALPVVPQLTPMAPTVISKPTLNDIIIAPFILLTHYFLHIYNPETISFGTGHHSSQEGNTLYQDRSQGSWPLLDHLLGGVHRSWVLNSSQPRSSDRP